MAPRTKTLNPEDVFIENPANPPMTLSTVRVPDPAPEPVEYDDATALNKVLDELGAEESDGFVVVHRETVDGGRRSDEYLDRYPVTDFTLAGLKAQWGPGKYKINVYHGGGQGLATRKTITIAKDPAAATPVAQPVNDLMPVIAAIKEQGDKTLQAILALAQANQHPQTSRMDMLHEMQLMREIIGGGATAATPPANFNPVEMLKLGVELAQNGAGGLENNNSWMNKVIDQFGPLLTGLAGGAMANAPGAVPVAPVRPALTAPVARPDVTPAPTSAQPEENPVNIIIAQYLKMLTRAAEVNAPVDEYADSILASVPVSTVSDLENMLRPADWRERIKPHTTAVEQYPAWFTSLRDTLLQFIDEDKAAASESASAHLTPQTESGSVLLHANDDTQQPAPDSHPASPA